MRTVTIRLSGEDFSNAIVVMREWLERNGYEPTGYRYDQNEATVSMSVDFAVPEQAEAFAKRFDGQSGDEGPGTSAGDHRAASSDNVANSA